MQASDRNLTQISANGFDAPLAASRVPGEPAPVASMHESLRSQPISYTLIRHAPMPRDPAPAYAARAGKATKRRFGETMNRSDSQTRRGPLACRAGPKCSVSRPVEAAAEVADPERRVAIEAMTQERPATTAPEPSRRSRWIKLVGALICLGVLFGLWRFTPLREIVTADAVRHWAETFGRQPWAPLAILLAYTPASVIMFPRPLITLAAVVAFGPWLGSVYALGGIELAALSGYFAGWGVSRDRLRRIGGRSLDALSARLRSGGLAVMVLVRLLPVAPFVVVSLFAGAARVGLTAFVLGTAIGMAPGLIGMAVFGAQVGGALSGDGHFNIWLIAGVIAVIAVTSLLARRVALRGNRPGRSARIADRLPLLSRDRGCETSRADRCG